MALLAFVTLAAGTVLGPVALAAPLVAACALWLTTRPGLAVTVSVVAAAAVESAADWGPSPFPSRIYDLLPGTKITGVEALLVLALAATMLDRRARGRPVLLPGPLAGPLALLGLGLVAGAWVGRNAGVGLGGIVEAGRPVVPLLLVPFLIVQVADTQRGLRRALEVFGAVAAFKGIAGVLAYAGGFTALSVGAKLTYYESPANLVMLVFLCFGLGALLTRQRLAAWVWLTLPFALLALTLSFRRSFWIAAVLALALVALVAVGQHGRRLWVPAVIALAAALALLLAGGGAGPVVSPSPTTDGSFSLRSELASINPTAIANNRDDRYRIGERRNVLAELEEEPVAGLGLGVGYRTRYPLSIGDITNQYVHVAALWWWMKLGILGLIGYVWLLGTAIAGGRAVWRRHPDPVVQLAGLAAAAGIIGYAVAEVTATFSGADPRSSIVVGGLLGILAAAWDQTPSARDPAA